MHLKFGKQLAVALCLAFMGCATAPQQHERAARAVDYCTLDKLQNDASCPCPVFSPLAGKSGARFGNARVLGNFTSTNADEVLVPTRGCGRNPGAALFERKTNLVVAYIDIDLDDCAIQRQALGPDVLFCTDMDRSPDGSRSTLIRQIYLGDAGLMGMDTVVGSFSDPRDTCPTGEVAISTNVSLEEGRESVTAHFEQATVSVPSDADYCTWAQSNETVLTPSSRVLQVTENANRGPQNPTESKPPEHGDFCDAENLRRVVGMKAPNIKACFEDLLTAEPDPTGRATFRVDILLSGNVGSVSVWGREKPLKHPGFRHCVANALRRMEFEPPDGGMCILDYPLVFGAAE